MTTSTPAETPSPTAPQDGARSRWNPWPYAIIGWFVLVIAGTVVLIVVANTGPNELVATDYYDREIRYQERLDQLRRTEPWANEVTVAAVEGGRLIRVQLPVAHAALGVEGEVEFYRPSAAGLDRKVTLKLDATGAQVVAADGLLPGLWQARLGWRVGGESFHAERRLVIPSEPGRPAGEG